MGVLVYKLAPASGQDHVGMSYDGLSRLTSVTTTNPEGFGFDPASNLTSRTGPAATYAIDGANRPTGDGVNSFSWSNADRLTARGTDSFTYDPLGRMTSSTVGGANRSYTYNGDGLLASATSGVTTTSELFDPSRAPAPLLLTGTTRLVYGLAPLYADSGTATTTFARDGLGSVRAEVSATGAVSNAFRYAAYGRLVQSVGGAPATLGYAGELADPTGLIYLRARWYDPGMGRFMSADPSRGDPSSPMSVNAFAYGGDRPTVLVDPSGLDPGGLSGFEVVGALVAGAGGAVSGAEGVRGWLTGLARSRAAGIAGGPSLQAAANATRMAGKVARLAPWLAGVGLGLSYLENRDKGYSERDAAIIAGFETASSLVAGAIVVGVCATAGVATVGVALVGCAAAVPALSYGGATLGEALGRSIVESLPR